MKVHIVQSKRFGTIYGVFATEEAAKHFLYDCEHSRISVTEHDVIGWVGPTSSVTITPDGQQIIKLHDTPPLMGDIDFNLIPIEKDLQKAGHLEGAYGICPACGSVDVRTTELHECPDGTPYKCNTCGHTYCKELF